MQLKLKSELNCHACNKSAETAKQEGGKLTICSGCKGVSYCSKACQREHWKAGHRHECTSSSSPSSGVQLLGAVFAIGDKVEIHDLIAAAHLNGKVGELLEFDDEAGRWLVKLDVSRGETKKVKPANLRRLVARNVDTEVRPQSHFVAAACTTVHYEKEDDFAAEASINLPITADVAAPGQWSSMVINGEVVEPNLVRRNLHGRNIFVLKVQMSSTGSDMLMYDHPRHMFLNISRDESGKRGCAYDVFARITMDHGVRAGDAAKVYVFAKREGCNLRAYTERIPCQIQPF